MSASAIRSRPPTLAALLLLGMVLALRPMAKRAPPAPLRPVPTLAEPALLGPRPRVVVAGMPHGDLYVPPAGLDPGIEVRPAPVDPGMLKDLDDLMSAFVATVRVALRPTLL
jgi:hypothetical protein